MADRVDGHYVRDEGLQAREIAEQLTILDMSGVEGAFVFTFAVPNSPYNPDPRFDSDMANYSLVKSYPGEGDLQGVGKTSGRTGKGDVWR